jgi:hypothetical protein
MKTIEINLYKFSELSEAAKQKALDKLYDINVDHNWWEFTYDDAEDVGLKLTGFDLDRNLHCTGEFYYNAEECAELILKKHGEMCQTFKTAQQYISDKSELVEKYSDGVQTNIVTEENEYDFDQDCDELENEFLESILEDYAHVLQNEYEYLTSEAAIIETIEANDYDFTENGKLY